MNGKSRGSGEDAKAPQTEHSYRAFLSYRSTDRKLAEYVVRRLERWRTPASLVGKPGRYGPTPRQLGRICRDREEFPTAAHVDGVIADKLSESQMLVVLCTPEAAAERSWVSREIELFRRLRPDGEIHALIGHGDPPGCFPKALLSQEADGTVSQPLAADMRRVGDGRDRALIKLTAGLLGVEFDDLWKRERRARAARMTRTLIAACSLVVAIGYGIAWLDARAWRSALVAEALGLISEGRVLDATPLALAGAAPTGALAFASGDQVQAAFDRLPGTAEQFDLGALEQPPEFSGDGKWLAAWSDDNTWFALDTATGDRLELGVLAEEPTFGADSARLVALTPDGEGFGIDLATGERTSFGKLACAPTFLIGGARVLLQQADGRTILKDFTGGQVEIDGPRNCDATVSPRGTYVAMSMQDVIGPMIVDARSGEGREWTELQGWPEFSETGDWLVDVRPSGSTALFNAATGARVSLFGAYAAEPMFSPSGAALAWREGESWFAANPSLGTKWEVGKLQEPPRFSRNGRQIAGLRTDGTATLVNVDTGSRKDLGKIWYSGTAWALEFSADGSQVAFRDPSGAGTVLQLTTGKQLPFGGSFPFLEFSPDGDWLIARSEDQGYFLTNLRSVRRLNLGKLRFATFSPTGHALVVMDDAGAAYLRSLETDFDIAAPAQTRAGSLCSPDATGLMIRSFAADFRLAEPAEGNADDTARRGRALAPLLAGRPWNPCDWRGLGAVFPDPARGDGWFEGARQWWRLMSVRWLGADDYACGETVSQSDGSLKKARQASCR